MKKLRRILATAALTIGALTFAFAPAAEAACYYYPPTSGYDGHVHYYNCRGPYASPYYQQAAWSCYADWDSYAEWFWGKHDGTETVYAGRTCYA